MRAIVSFILCMFAGSMSATKSLGKNPWLFVSTEETKQQYISHHEILTPVSMIFSKKIGRSRDLMVLFRNDGEYQIRSNKGIVTINGVDYKGKAYGRTSLGFELGYPIRPQKQGALIIKIIGDSKWQQCSAHQVEIKGLNNLELQPISVVPFVAKLFSSGRTKLWLRDVDYASSCSHVQLRDREEKLSL